MALQSSLSPTELPCAHAQSAKATVTGPQQQQPQQQLLEQGGACARSSATGPPKEQGPAPWPERAAGATSEERLPSGPAAPPAAPQARLPPARSRSPTSRQSHLTLDLGTALFDMLAEGVASQLRDWSQQLAEKEKEVQFAQHCMHLAALDIAGEEQELNGLLDAKGPTLQAAKRPSDGANLLHYLLSRHYTAARALIQKLPYMMLHKTGDLWTPLMVLCSVPLKEGDEKDWDDMLEHYIAALEQSCEHTGNQEFLQSLGWANMEGGTAFDMVAQKGRPAPLAKLLDALVRAEGKSLVIAEELLRHLSCTREHCFDAAVSQMKERNARLRARFVESSTEAALEQQRAGT